MPPLADLDAVLFDMDGTLVRTFIDFERMRREMHDLAAHRGVAASTEGETDILGIVSRMSAALPGGEAEDARREAWAILERIEAEGCARPEPVGGASALLRRLRDERGVRIAVITRNSRRISEGLLRDMDLNCDLLLAREDTLRHKPDPEPIFHACRILEVDPRRCAVVGDLWTDIAAGRSAGAQTVGIQWPHDPPNRFARCAPHYEVPSLQAASVLFFGTESHAADIA